MAVNKLLRSGLTTKEDLITSGLEKLSDSHGFLGKKTKDLASRLQNLAIAEQYLEWNSYNR